MLKDVLMRGDSSVCFVVTLADCDLLQIYCNTTQAGTPYLSPDEDTLARRHLLLPLGPQLFGMIQAITLMAFAAFSQA